MALNDIIVPKEGAGGVLSEIALADATTGASGLMSSSDKTKLDGIAEGATANAASTATPQALGTAAAGTASAYAREDHVHPVPFGVPSALSLEDSANPDPSTPSPALSFNSGQSAPYWSVVEPADLRQVLGAAAASHTHTAADISDSTAAGRALLTAADAAAQRASLELGTAAVEAASAFAAASHAHTASAITSGTIDAARLGSGTANSGTYLRGDQTWAAVTAGIGGSTGSTDAAILRAAGTGGATAQASDLVIDDAVVAYAVTGDASTDIITAVGHNYTANQAVRFQVLAGGSGLNNTTTYFVRDISGDTLKVSTSSGGAAVNFTTNITGGSIVAIQPNVALHLQKYVFSITADASTDIITATGHNFVNGDPVTFSSLVGGAGLDVITRYFVIDASANQLKVSTSAGGSAVNITTNYTDGVIELDVALVLGGNRLGGLVLGNKPDGTTLGGNPRGSGAVDLLQVRTQATQVASGINAFQAGGRNNTASGLDAVVLGGNNNTASAYLSGVICSAGSSATGQASVVLAGSNASATSAEGCLAIGVRALADRAQIIAQGCGHFGSTGDAQRIHSVLRGKTTTNTAVELLTSTNTNQRLTCPSGKVMAMIVNITGVKSDGSAVAHYVRQYAIKNVGGTTSEVYAPVTIGTDNAASTSIALSANDTNDALKIECTGIASETWRWVASVDVVEVAYGT